MDSDLPQLPQDALAIDALIFMREITKAIGPGFHPDTPGSDYVNIHTNVPSFTAQDAARLDADLDKALELLESAGRDPYKIGCRVQRRMMGLPVSPAIL